MTCDYVPNRRRVTIGYYNLPCQIHDSKDLGPDWRGMY